MDFPSSKLICISLLHCIRNYIFKKRGGGMATRIVLITFQRGKKLSYYLFTYSAGGIGSMGALDAGAPMKILCWYFIFFLQILKSCEI